MSVSQTSLFAFSSIKHELQPREKEVMKVIEMQAPIDNLGISYALNWPINSVTGRTNSLSQAKYNRDGELIRPAMIQIEEVKPTRTGRKAKFWGVA